MSDDVAEVARIAKRLTKAQREAWKACYWDGEYYNEPNLPVWVRPGMRRLGLLADHNNVTRLGERLIAYLLNEAQP